MRHPDNDAHARYVHERDLQRLIAHLRTLLRKSAGELTDPWDRAVDAAAMLPQHAANDPCAVYHLIKGTGGRP